LSSQALQNKVTILLEGSSKLKFLRNRPGAGAPLRDFSNNVRKETIDSRNNEYQNPRNAYIPASQASSKPQFQEPEPNYNQQQYGNQQNVVSLNGEDVSKSPSIVLIG
jgi:hypothetical protein